MIVNRMFWGLVLVALGLVSCNQDEIGTDQPTRITTVTAVMPEFSGMDETRVALTNSQNSWQFKWQSNDKIGIYFPPSGGIQDAIGGSWFNLVSGEGTNLATFTGNGFDLHQGQDYYALYPLTDNVINMQEFTGQNELSATFDYSGQVQTTHDSTDHLGKYSYMFGKFTADGNGLGIIPFRFLGSVFKITLRNLPTTVKFKELEVIAPNDKEICTSQMLMFNSGSTSTYEPWDGYKKCILSFGSGITPQKVATDPYSGSIYGITAYLMMVPQTLFDWMDSDAKFTFVVRDELGRSMVGYADAKNPAEGKVTYFQPNMMWQAQSGTNKTGDHEFVDLGITGSSGETIYWAKTNIGAESEYEAGDYYAWGETETHYLRDNSGNFSWTKPGFENGYTWGTYKYADANDEYTLNKYTFDDGYKDGIWYKNKTTFIGDNNLTLSPEDDAATVNWGENWRIPSNSEWQALLDGCNWEWNTNYKSSGMQGYKVSNKKDSSKYIFLPARGFIVDDRLDYYYNYGYDYGFYWASDLGNHSSQAYSLSIRSNNKSCSPDFRYKGSTIRPVCVMK